VCRYDIIHHEKLSGVKNRLSWLIRDFILWIVCGHGGLRYD